MKQALLFAVTVSAMTVPGAALAIDTTLQREVRVSGLGDSLGTLTFLARGRVGTFCRYLTTWESPYNPNDVLLCDTLERRTVLFPSCIENRRKDVPTTLQAGALSSVGTECWGFDMLGEAFDVSLLMFQTSTGLQGLVFYPYGAVLPIEASS